MTDLRTPAVGSEARIVVAAADEQERAKKVTPQAVGGTVPFAPAISSIRAHETVGLTLPAPVPRSHRIAPSAADRLRDQKVQVVLQQLVAEPLNTTEGGTTSPAVVMHSFYARRNAIAEGLIRDHHMGRELAYAVADQWVSRNVARWNYQRTTHHGDGLRALTVAGMLIAVANEGGTIPPQLLAEAIATRDRVRADLIAAGMDAQHVDNYIAGLASRVSTTTGNWRNEEAILKQQKYYEALPPPPADRRTDAGTFVPPQYAKLPSGAQVVATTDDAQQQTRRALAAAGEDHARRVDERRRADVHAHLENLEAQGRPVGGPTYS